MFDAMQNVPGPNETLGSRRVMAHKSNSNKKNKHGFPQFENSRACKQNPDSLLSEFPSDVSFSLGQFHQTKSQGGFPKFQNSWPSEHNPGSISDRATQTSAKNIFLARPIATNKSELSFL